MKRLFGTDGMRGEAGRFPLDAETVRVAGRSLARHLSERTGAGAPRVVTGRDTRESGAWIERAFLAGAREAGAACSSAGVVTTPGVAYLARTLPTDAGIVISASHNPYHDNGIKIFAPDGRKLDDATERLIEADIYAAREGRTAETGTTNGQHVAVDESASVVDSVANEDGATDDERAAELRERYLDYLADEVGAGLRLDGLKVVADCANGAAYALAPALLRRLGADVVATNDAPDGRNINENCGSLHLEGLQRRVVEEEAAFGVAFDGDADRALFVDARGQLVDGDATLWVMAAYLQERGRLASGCVVATVMSNLGLELALRSRG
ncbi:MAG TPA: hypothetical protein VFX96_01605, partial [Pyrinomonadaceae bacterium]|nr:hypothetical protein [Pyrinomonadaceae bacterium]